MNLLGLARGPILCFGLIVFLLLLTGCKTGHHSSSLSVKEKSFNSLPGWEKDDKVHEAFHAFRKSCPVLLKGDPHRTMGFGTKAKDWHSACKRALSHNPKTHHEAREFFEEHFRPHHVKYGPKNQGVFTGYYESELRGSRHKTDEYSHPIYAPPKDLICHASSKSCGKKSFFGGIAPHHDRQAIHEGALKNKNLEIVWVDDPVESFFMHIQGSARVVLDNGKVVRLMYAGSNGHPFVPIGRVLLERKQVRPESMSMQSIRKWMKDNPHEATKLMNKNPRYIFFKEFHGEGPIGCMGAPLTPGRSLAVDRAFIPMGAPLWVNTHYPENYFKIQRLFIAQDTGSAIKGPIRGDIFWGYGKEATHNAGKTKVNGEYYIFLPS